MNIKKALFSLVVVIFSLNSQAQESMSYFLPDDVNYNEKIPTPEKFFNQQIGEWHLTYDQILSYLKEVSRLSSRAILKEYARSYENRPLVYFIVTSEENQKNLPELKQLHASFSEPDENIPVNQVPLVVTMGYGVHGNESSATNSSVLTAYYLAAAEGEKIDRLLEKTIILIDPSLNPDGFTRHSTWANMYQSYADTPQNESRQFHEMWPGGRTNHYWFDLNRDYLLLVHPESRGRVKKFYEWKPNIVTDHHEMDANSTFFFQPGVPSRNNPLTPEENYELTHKIAQYHAKHLDEIGSAYFSEERFDDFYYGKGSSFPDVNGGIGILFEQAGFRGRIRETINGVRNFAFAIRNQFTVTLSTLEAATEMHDELLQFQKEFYTSAIELAEEDPVKAYVFGKKNDRVKMQLFVNYLKQHQIQLYPAIKNINAENRTFEAGSAYIVPLRQKQYRLIKSLFEEVVTFTDSTFYDVSTWTMPYAFDIPFARLENIKKSTTASQPAEIKTVSGEITGGKSSVGYVFRWNEYTAPAALYPLLEDGLTAKVATKSFSFSINNKNENFSNGTIFIPASNQNLNDEKIYSRVKAIAEKTGVKFYALETGLSPTGIDLGSNSFKRIEKPEILMLTGEGVNSRDAGEIWHLFDQRYHIPVTLMESSDLASADLNRYNVIILPGGSYSRLNTDDIQQLKNRTEQGAVLIACKNAASWAARNNFAPFKFERGAAPDSAQKINYASREKYRSYNLISGAIFNTEMDLTHPLCYGYTDKYLPVFKTGTTVANPSGAKNEQPVNFTGEPYISGYVSGPNLEKIKNAPVVSVHKIGKGKIIAYHENMTFRGIWLGTNKLFSNAVFFGKIID